MRQLTDSDRDQLKRIHDMQEHYQRGFLNEKGTLDLIIRFVNMTLYLERIINGTQEELENYED